MLLRLHQMRKAMWSVCQHVVGHSLANMSQRNSFTSCFMMTSNTYSVWITCGRKEDLQRLFFGEIFQMLVGTNIDSHSNCKLCIHLYDL